MKNVINTTAKLLTPIHTGSDEVAGIDKTIRRREFLINGENVIVPIISANSLRGILRRVLAADFLNLLGLGDDSIDPKFYYILFSGGALEKTSGKIEIENRKTLFENIPMLHLLGSAVGNAIIPGTLIVEDMLPIVKELEEFTGIRSDISLYEVVSEEFGTRRDDYPYKDEVETDKHQMLYRYEVIKAGTEMTFNFSLLSVANELDEIMLKRGIDLMLNEARVGGKGAVGLGKITLRDFNLVNPTLYFEYIKDNRDKILRYLKDSGFIKNESILV